MLPLFLMLLLLCRVSVLPELAEPGSAVSLTFQLGVDDPYSKRRLSLAEL
jgi:hypothetical protein